MRSAASLAVLCLLLCGCGGGPRDLLLHDCSPGLQDSGRVVECFTVRVPERGAEFSTGARAVVLEVVRVRASRPVAGLPPVIYLHGGPGGGVLEDLDDVLRSDIAKQLVAQDQDWVFFDQRGTGLARPLLDCGELALNDAGPLDADVVQQLIECGQRLSAQGIALDTYHSQQVALDVQAIRRALRLGSFDVYGLSYGTRVAAAVVATASSGLRAVVLDSPWPPEATWTESGPTWVSHEARELLRACAADTACGAAHPDLETRLDTLLRSWRDGDRALGATNARQFALFLMDALYEPTGVASLPQDIERVVRGDLSLLRGRGADGAGYAEGLHMATLCNEELPLESAERVREYALGDPIAEAVASTMVNYFPACAGFVVKPRDPLDAAPVESNIPTLFLAAGIDAGCPAEFSEVAVRGFSRGQLVVMPFSTHQVAVNSLCARTIARQFLRQPTEAVKRTCVAEEQAGISFH